VTRRFPIGLTIAVVIAFAICVGLGVWQLRRLEWKEGVLARREALLTAAPRPLVPALNATKDNPEALDLVRVEVVCAGLSQAPYEELYGLAQGQMVTRLVSPCRLEGAPYEAILVDRGYVLQTISSRPAIIEGDTYPSQVVGILSSPSASMRAPAGEFEVDRLPPSGAKKLWMGRDLSGMAAALGVRNPAPYFLMAETSSNPDWKALVPGMPPVIIRNNHLSYAFTWFGLAAVLVAIYAAMLRKRLKS
jgi:surfeit locus 1 family protein